MMLRGVDPSAGKATPAGNEPKGMMGGGMMGAK